MLLLTFSLLALSICFVWIDKPYKGFSYRLSPWLVCFFSAMLCGLGAGILNHLAVIFLLLLLALAWLSKNQTRPILKFVSMTCSIILALAIALHKIPGFSNPVILNSIQVSNDAIPYTLYANFDKGAAGLILLTFFCPRVVYVRDIKKLFKPIVVGTIATSVIVFSVAFAEDYIHFDFKISPITLSFLIINLFFVCIAEEAFFRGVIQEQLMCLSKSSHLMKWVAIVTPATLFGLAHFAGGTMLVILSTLAGFGYSLTYSSTRKIESAIATHFFVNAIHFILFTYPAIEKVTR